jgi:exosortase/archaeosortase family protein
MATSFLARKTVRRFLIRFFAVFFLVELTLAAAPPLAYQEWLAAALGNVFALPVNGTFLFVEGIRFEISAFCTGLSTWGLFAGLLAGFSHPKGWKKIVYGLAGWVIIFGFNFLRLALIVYVGKTYDATIVDTLHTLTWFGMSALVLSGWFFLLSVELKTKNAQRLAEMLLEEKK